MTGDTDRGIHAELYVRSLAPRGVEQRQAAVLERLDSLVAQGVLSAYDVYVCGHRLPARPAEADVEFARSLLNRLAVFSEWADRNGHSLDSVFASRTVDSSLTGRTRDVITLPVMALAEYEGADLRYVAPCTGEEGTVTVQERLDALQAGAPTETTPLPDAYGELPVPSRSVVGK